MTFTGVDFMPSSDEAGIDAHHTIPRVVFSHAVSMSGLAKSSAAPGRNDEMVTKDPENSVRPERPVLVPPPDTTGGGR